MQKVLENVTKSPRKSWNLNQLYWWETCSCNVFKRVILKFSRPKPNQAKGLMLTVVKV